MLKKIYKVARALDNAGINYELATSYDSRARLDTTILKWTVEGRRVVFTEDTEGFTSLKVSNPDLSDVIAIVKGKF